MVRCPCGGELVNLDRLLEPLRNRIRAIVSRALVSSVTMGEDGMHAEATLLDGEVRDQLEVVQQYGFSSKPAGPTGAVVLFVSGSRESGIMISTKGLSTEMVFTLQDGEVALHTAEGDSVHLKKGRVVSITTNTLEIHAAQEVKIDSPKITTTGDLTTGGQVSDPLGSLATLRSTYNAHTHLSTAPGTPTGPAVPLA